MQVFLSIILLIVGFVALIKGADVFVDGASSTAENFKVSKILIGLTIIAFGTSAPEFAVSLSAIASGSTDMVLGNVIGSCILNILLILGIAAIIHPIKISDDTVKKELPLCMLISVLLAVLILDVFLAGGEINQITRSDAIVILLFFSVFLYYLITLARKNRQEDSSTSQPKYHLGKSLIFIVIGLAGIILGSELVVSSATTIAEAIGFSERVIALTIIAFGTSLPELVTTVVAARKGEQDLAVGNIIGSNIFNICVVLGVPVALFGTITPIGFQTLDIIMLVASAILIFLFSITTKKINRIGGAIMLIVFCIYYGIVLLV